jgi:uncharacterized protein (DUF58 family)
MSHTFFLSLITLGLIISGLASLNATIIGLAFPFAILLLTSVATHPRELKLKVDRRLSDNRVLSGEPVVVSLTVTNVGDKAGLVLIEDQLPPNLSIISGDTCHLIYLDKDLNHQWDFTVQGERGFYQFNKVRVETQDPFSITTQRKHYLTKDSLWVLPDMLNVKRLSIRPRKTRVYSGEIPTRSGGLGVEFFGVREFQPGDAQNWINWRLSARYQAKLFSNEYEQERVADVGIILDGRERSNILADGKSIFEQSVLAASTLANTFINQGNRVSLLHYGKFLHWVYPGYGKYQREKILRTLSESEPGHSLVFSYLEHIPTRIFPPQSQIVIISPLAKDDTKTLLQLRALGYRVLAICPNPISFEMDSLETTKETELAFRIMSIERNIQLRKLIQGGIRIVDWDVSEPFDQVVGTLQRSPIIIRSVATSP